MNYLLPTPDVERPPKEWPPLTLLAAVILLEAESEPEQGQIAVGYVIRWRVDHRIVNAVDARVVDDEELLPAVILSPYQFSSLNFDYAAQRQTRLTAIDPHRWNAMCRIAAGTWWRWLPNPAPGCGWYLNPVLTQQQRGGTMPAWYDPAKVVVSIGQHEFLRA